MHRWPLIAFFALFLALSGCGTVVPTQRQENAATRVADQSGGKSQFEYATRIHPSFWPEVTVSNIGKGTVRVVPPLNVDTTLTSEMEAKAGSRDIWSFSLIQTIPLGVRLILLAIGLIMLMAVAWYLFRKFRFLSVAKEVADRRAAEAIAKADQAFSDMADKARERAVVANDPKEAAVAALETARVEKARGKLRAAPLPGPTPPPQ